MYAKDAEVLELKRRAGADYRDLANILGKSPARASQLVLGFGYWQPGQRERVIRYLREQIEQRQKAESCAA